MSRSLIRHQIKLSQMTSVDKVRLHESDNLSLISDTNINMEKESLVNKVMFFPALLYPIYHIEKHKCYGGLVGFVPWDTSSIVHPEKMPNPEKKVK